MPKRKKEVLLNQTRTRSIGCKVRKLEMAGVETSTLTFVFVSNDNSGVRYDWGTGEYYNEILDVNGANVERLRTFFKDHYRNSDSASGKISNVRVEDGQLIGDVTFGSDVKSQELYTKYREEILTDVSIGYEIHEYNVESGATNERDNVTVSKFDIFEVSAVGIGFDSGAKKRENENNGGLLEMNKELKERLAKLEAMVKRSVDEQAEMVKLVAMRDADVTTPPTTPPTTKSSEDMVRVLAENANLKRQNDIRVIGAKYDIPQADIVRHVDDSKMTVEGFRTFILDSIVASKGDNDIGDGEESTRSGMLRAMADGLALRLGVPVENPHSDADKYRYAPLTSIGNDLLPESERSHNPHEIAERSLLSGDFPILLQSIGSRVLTSEFEASTGTYKVWMKEVDVPDFRVMTDVTSSVGGGRLSKLLENGDLKELKGNEKAETWQIGSFGNAFIVTREMLINDDLSGFTNLIANFAVMAQTTANGIAYDILQNKGAYENYKMADGSGMWVASRNNSATDALSSTALSAGRLAMSKHKSIDGKTPLKIVPKFLVISPALEVTALEILGAMNKLGADNTGVPNVNKNAYELIIDPEIESDTAWYLLAERRTIKMGFLAGTNRSPVVKVNESSLTRTKYEGVFDIGAMVEDFRGLYRGNV